MQIDMSYVPGTCSLLNISQQTEHLASKSTTTLPNSSGISISGVPGATNTYNYLNNTSKYLNNTYNYLNNTSK